MSDIDPAQIVKLLEQYGPWTIVLILLAAVYFLYRHMMKRLDEKDKSYGNLLEKRHDQFIQVLSECSTTLGQAKDEIKETKDLNKRIEELLITIRALLLARE